jgi:hypothetical protein
MNNRTNSILTIGALLLALLISSCSQGQPETTAAADDLSVFELDNAERSALALNDDSALTVEFGDPALGIPVLSAPPSNTQLAEATGQPTAGKSASTWGRRSNDCDDCKRDSDKCDRHQDCDRDKDKCKKEHTKKCDKHKDCGKDRDKCSKHKSCDKPCDDDCDCDKCRPEKCVKVTGICNLTERFWQADDACDLEVDVSYKAEVTVEDGGSRAGLEVTFSRDGQVVGTALTGADGIATFTESGVARGPHQTTACVAASRTGSCRSGKTCGDPKCPTRDDAKCKPQISVVFTRTSVEVTSSKDLSNVVLKFCDGCEKKFDGLCGRTGTFMGTGTYAGKTIAGAWIKSGCNKSGDGPGYGEWFPNPLSDCECKPCITYDGCSNCSTSPVDGKLCSTQDIAVYTNQIWGAVTGTGYINACNPLRIGSRAGMNFRAAYDNGQVQGYLNFWDGSIKVTNGQINWLVISGVESWFGGDNWVVHVVDNGKDFRNDTFEIWITDPVSKCCYHCGGRLVGCYVNISYRYTQVCP